MIPMQFQLMSMLKSMHLNDMFLDGMIKHVPSLYHQEMSIYYQINMRSNATCTLDIVRITMKHYHMYCQVSIVLQCLHASSWTYENLTCIICRLSQNILKLIEQFSCQVNNLQLCYNRYCKVQLFRFTHKNSHTREFYVCYWKPNKVTQSELWEAFNCEIGDSFIINTHIIIYLTCYPQRDFYL